MSKIAEKKALEAYPVRMEQFPFCLNPQDTNESQRRAYKEGYEQAMQDIEEWFISHTELSINDYVAGELTKESVFEQIKN